MQQTVFNALLFHTNFTFFDLSQKVIVSEYGQNHKTLCDKMYGKIRHSNI